MVNKSSPTVNRRLLHKREVKCFGYERYDGDFDIEGHLTDVKTYGVDGFDRGSMKPGEPVHDMWLRLTVDVNLKIKGSKAEIVWSPYNICKVVEPNFNQLVGEVIGPGFTKRVRRRLGGTHGCTHLVELLGPIATTAFQTIYPKKSKPSGEVDKERKPTLLNTCHAWADDSDMVKVRHPKFFTGIKVR